MNWYYVEAGQQTGPVDDAGLAVLVASGRVTGETLVWREGMANWQAYREVHPGAVSAAAPAAPGLRISRPASAESAPGGSSTPGGEEAVCAECGNMFPVNDTIRLGDVRVCANCKPIYVQKLREGVSVGAVGSLRYAGFWIRFAAKFLDGLIVGVVVFVPMFILFFWLGVSAVSRGQGNVAADPAGLLPQAAAMNPAAQMAIQGMGLLAQVVITFFSAIYSCFFIGKYGATPGKMACGLRVVQPDGSPVGYGRAFGRGCAEFVSRLICSIGYIMAAFDSEKRALHDRMCNTRVIYK